MDRAAEIADFVAARLDGRPGSFDPDNLFGPGRLEGDDAAEFLQAFATRFGVDLSGFRDYLHFNPDEPLEMRRTWGGAPDGTRIADIPVGLADLGRAAEAGRWVMDYPPHVMVEAGMLGQTGMGFVKAVGLAALALLIIWALDLGWW